MRYSVSPPSDPHGETCRTRSLRNSRGGRTPRRGRTGSTASLPATSGTRILPPLRPEAPSGSIRVRRGRGADAFRTTAGKRAAPPPQADHPDSRRHRASAPATWLGHAPGATREARPSAPRTRGSRRVTATRAGPDDEGGDPEPPPPGGGASLTSARSFQGFSLS